MATPEIINVNALLAPISPSAPAGVNLRLDASPSSIYFRLKDARGAARAAERRADAEGGNPSSSAEWQEILTLAPRVLAETSKDLEVAAWLIEGLVRTRGFAGLRDGVRVARGLVEDYWETFFSLEDEDGMATRLAPLAGLNGQGSEGTLIQPLRKVALTTATDEGAFAIYHYDQARTLSHLEDPDARARREAAGEVNMERFTAAMNSSGGAFYIELLDDLGEALTEIDGLGNALDARAGRDAPSMSALKAVLVTIRDAVTEFSADLVARARAAPGATPAPGAAGTADASVGGDMVVPVGTVRGREDALRVLLQVAEFFRKYEPHSPISTSLEEIVRRAKMPFAELLAELLPDTASWRSALTSAGIKPPPEGG